MTDLKYLGGVALVVSVGSAGFGCGVSPKDEPGGSRSGGTAGQSASGGGSGGSTGGGTTGGSSGTGNATGQSGAAGGGGEAVAGSAGTAGSAGLGTSGGTGGVGGSTGGTGGLGPTGGTAGASSEPFCPVGADGCVRLTVSNTETEPLELEIPLAAPSNLNGTTIRCRFYVDSGTGGSITVWAENGNTLEIGLGEPIAPIESLMGWGDANFTVAAAGPFTPSPITKIGVRIEGTSEAVIYFDSVIIDNGVAGPWNFDDSYLPLAFRSVPAAGAILAPPPAAATGGAGGAGGASAGSAGQGGAAGAP